MLSRFSNEVLSRGPSAVLPQNLSGFWLKTLQKLCDDFLDQNFAVDQCVEPSNMGDPLLVACVHEVLRANRGGGADVAADELAENVTIFALSVTMESIRRESDIEMPAPTLENLLSVDRIVDFGRINPAFGRFLERACIIADGEAPGEESWLQRMKKRILAHINA